MRKFLSLILILFIAETASAQIKTVPIIFDSDMGPDYDDVGAIAILHAFADSGYAKILAACASTKYNGVAGVMSVFNTYFGRPDIPIGTPKGNASEQRDWQHWTDTILAHYTHAIKNNTETPDAVDVYRNVLSVQPDKSVTIVTVGFLTNLAALLDSKPDKYSPLSGRELVEKKVKKLVSMAGAFPSGREYNVFTDSVSSKYVFENWPTEILFDGFEIGVRVKTGLPLIHNAEIKSSPVKDVFGMCIPMAKGDAKGRMSWDEIAVLVAVKGWQPWFTLHSGRIIVEESGSNKWDENSSGHNYLVFARPIEEIEDYLNSLMQHQPESIK